VHSLRWKLIVGILSGMTLLLGLGGAAAYLTIKKKLYAEFDRSLVQRTVLLASMIEHDASGIKIEWLENATSPPGHQPGLDYFSIWTWENSETLAASPDLERGILPRFGGSFANPEVREVKLPGDRRVRCAGIAFDARKGLRGEDDADDRPNAVADAEKTTDPLIVQLVVAKVDTVMPTIAAIRQALLGLWTGCTAVGGFMIWLLVRRGLRPLDELKTQIGSLEEGVAGQRVALRKQPAELEPVTDELNCLLERVEKVLVRERTLTSNVAHELRTPIAGLLSTLEVTLNRLRSPDEYRESAQECFEIVKRMNWLVNNLLSIARIEAGNVQLQTQDVMIGNVLMEWWRPFETRARERGLQIDWDIEPDAKLQTDPEFLRVVVTNLFDNAVSYAPEGGTIRIQATSDGSISVANAANGLKPDAINRAFDPFWRNTDSRAGEVAHAGLGLNLCKKITEVLGGRISAQIKEPESLFVVRLEMA
jgi:signal transduction histidine kinase